MSSNSSLLMPPSVHPLQAQLSCRLQIMPPRYKIYLPRNVGKARRPHRRPSRQGLLLQSSCRRIRGPPRPPPPSFLAQQRLRLRERPCLISTDITMIAQIQACLRAGPWQSRQKVLVFRIRDHWSKAGPSMFTKWPLFLTIFTVPVRGCAPLQHQFLRHFGLIAIFRTLMPWSLPDLPRMKWLQQSMIRHIKLKRHGTASMPSSYPLQLHKPQYRTALCKITILDRPHSGMLSPISNRLRRWMLLNITLSYIRRLFELGRMCRSPEFARYCVSTEEG